MVAVEPLGPEHARRAHASTGDNDVASRIEVVVIHDGIVNTIMKDDLGSIGAEVVSVDAEGGLKRAIRTLERGYRVGHRIGRNILKRR